MLKVFYKVLKVFYKMLNLFYKMLAQYKILGRSIISWYKIDGERSERGKLLSIQAYNIFETCMRKLKMGRPCKGGGGHAPPPASSSDSPVKYLSAYLLTSTSLGHLPPVHFLSWTNTLTLAPSAWYWHTLYRSLRDTQFCCHSISRGVESSSEWKYRILCLKKSFGFVARM